MHGSLGPCWAGCVVHSTECVRVVCTVHGVCVCGVTVVGCAWHRVYTLRGVWYMGCAMHVYV